MSSVIGHIYGEQLIGVICELNFLVTLVETTVMYVFITARQLKAKKYWPVRYVLRIIHTLFLFIQRDVNNSLICKY